MGCGASRDSHTVVSNIEYVEVSKAWDRAWQTVPAKKGSKVKDKNLVVKRSSWKTVRIFVSSTFKDFHQEREVLIKKVFPDLRLWCETQRIRLVECDLRWGVPKDINTEGTLRACLGEIDRCYQDNIMPFFLNMTSERVGWVPLDHEVPVGISEEYQWVQGLSVTEMEILHGAYRIDNPNALFLLRDPSFLEGVPDEYKKRFQESNPVAEFKLDILKKMIHERFPSERICYYKVNYRGYNPDNKMVELDGLDDIFSKKVFEFFKERILAQYPLPQLANLDPHQLTKEQHESFMKNRSASVVGRAAMIKKVTEYIAGVAEDVPLLVVGEAGTGKSTIMARIAEETVTKAINGQIQGGGQKGWHVFYHFVGAVPGSTELDVMLKRLLVEIEVCNKTNMPTNLDNAAQTVCGALTNTNTNPVIIIIDALNQFDDDTVSHLVSWVPRKLAPCVRCVFSMIADTPQHTSFMKREPQPKVLEVSPLSYNTRKLMVTEMLGYYTKRLDEEQMESLLSKSSSANPLWLSIAVEELRVFGMFRQISDKINKLSNGLLELEIQILERFEKEASQGLLVSTLCLMEVSARGLLETELLAILGDEDHLMMKDTDKDDSTEKADTQREKTLKDMDNLPAFKWAEVYRNLKPFLRPFGDSGEGRLDFYHRSLSKAVRRKYFKDQNQEKRTDVYRWWHSKLADFFENCPNLDRKLEELPIHLQAIKDFSRLESLLTDYDVFHRLFHEEYSTKLIGWWRESVGFERMEECCMTAINNYANDTNNSTDSISQYYEKMARFMGQAGRFQKAEELSKNAMHLESAVLGSRPERMVEIYQLSATIQDEVMKMAEYMYRSQLPALRTIIGDFEKSAEIRRTLEGIVHKRRLGAVLNRLAFYYSSYSVRGGDAWLDSEAAREKGITAVEQAIVIFTELNDEVHVADSLTTRGVCYGRCCPPQLKAYKSSEEIFLRTVGELHHLLDRLYLNMAIYYEEAGDYYGAYQYFHKWYKVCSELYGKQHPRCSRCFNTLQEPMYRRIAQEKGIPVPSRDSD